MKGTGLSHVLGLPGLFHHSHQALLGLAGQAQRSAPRSGCDQGRRPAGHRKCLGAKSHTVSVCPLVTGPTSPGACRTCRGEAPAPPTQLPAHSPRGGEPGRVLVAFSLPSQGLPSGGRVPGSLRFTGSLESRPSFPGPLWPLLPLCGLPGPEAPCPSGGCSPVPSSSLACLCRASSGQLGPKSQLPSVCLPPSRPLTPPARPGVPAACPLPARLPAACPSCPHAGFWKEPSSPPGLAPVPGALEGLGQLAPFT